ncbi:MAG: 6-phosphofructokinase [Anaerolineae bacterium]|jgi:6-phosphofructokinase 1|nr:6-phosphofructokinase [Anaerolineae bacterium]
MASNQIKSVAVLTSGGDAPGMNAAVRAIVRTALYHGLDAYAIYEGYQGMVDGGKQIRKMDWDSVGGIQHRGGTIIGSARCAAFRTHEGRLQAAYNLVTHDINALVVIGGDGSLTGANLFRQEWPQLLAELVEQNQITAEKAEACADLALVGLVGSIDNDMAGTDMTIGADTALHRIAEAVDAIGSTASSHQRAFVVEVMGRNCGYLAMMSAIATGADWFLIPENPPDVDDWEAKLVEVLKAGRRAGNRDSMVILAEGARDRFGNPITSEQVKTVIENGLGDETRITILGHVQRGGAPSAFDRYFTTLLGHAAVQELLNATPDREPQVIGIRENRVSSAPLMESVKKTQAVAEAIAAHDYERAMDLRGGSFKESFRTALTLMRAMPHEPETGQRRLRLGVLNCGAPAAGMNTAVRAAVRLGTDKGHIMLGIRNGFPGLAAGQVQEMGWMSVAGWATRGGAELGTDRDMPTKADLYRIARTIEEQRIEGLLVIGGWAGYESAYQLVKERPNYHAFNIPIVCLPAAIDNNLPGSDLSVGADTALNNIVEAVDKIKQYAVAAQRCYVVEVMGRYCGYLALMAGLATGAERVYIHEEGITLADLLVDLESLKEGFRQGKRLGLVIRNENANPSYTTDVICALFGEEGRDVFDVRQNILGHLQQGGDPTPFDRIQATRLAARCIEYLIAEAEKSEPAGVFIGLQSGKVTFTDLEDLPRLADAALQRPKTQKWLDLRPIAKIMSLPGL